MIAGTLLAPHSRSVSIQTARISEQWLAFAFLAKYINPMIVLSTETSSAQAIQESISVLLILIGKCLGDF